jgi:acyl-coenzyme A synthetase/AMP-(fatty) acid ligase
MDVTSPATLTAEAVAAAAAEIGATVMFLSPAALTNVVATADDLTGGHRQALGQVRTFLSAGAPVSVSLLEQAAALMPGATPHTPYGMTEGLLMTDITLDGIREAGGPGDSAVDGLSDSPVGGVCVGRPVDGVRLLISALDDEGRATDEPSPRPGVTGEILVSAPHLFGHYDRLWLTDRASTRDVPADGRWHRTGDVGHLDDEGRLWIEGRIQHVLSTAQGPVTPVGPEQRIELAPGVRRAALVGVGPTGAQVAVAVIETEPLAARATLADPELAAAVRAVAGLPLAAVLVAPGLPTDVRHNSKIDRQRLASWASAILEGGPLGDPR